MTHEWKIGDWCDYGGVRCLVTDIEHNGIVVMPRYKTKFFTEDFESSFRSPAKDNPMLTHLPDCTGWGWQPPKQWEQPAFLRPGWIAMDEGGYWFYYTTKPILKRDTWENTTGRHYNICVYNWDRPIVPSWQESLREIV
jgi:hypothetical protein